MIGFSFILILFWFVVWFTAALLFWFLWCAFSCVFRSLLLVWVIVVWVVMLFLLLLLG